MIHMKTADAIKGVIEAQTSIVTLDLGHGKEIDRV
jgi:hypothetical protein